MEELEMKKHEVGRQEVKTEVRHACMWRALVVLFSVVHRGLTECFDKIIWTKQQGHTDQYSHRSIHNS